MADVTDDEVRDICSSFMLSAPPGEFMEVVTDIRGLIAKESLLNATAPAVFKQYNEEQLTLVASPKGSHKLILCEQSHVGENKYLDSKAKALVTYDHIKGSVVKTEDAGSAMDTTAEEWRVAVEEALFKYAADHYPDGAGAVYAKGKTLTIVIQSSKYNPGNFWNGRWRSVWTVNLGGSTASIKGNMKIQVHYFEDGNVQLNTNTNKSGSVSQTKPDDTAAAIIAEIKSHEQAFAKNLNVTFSTIGDTTFKALRRNLPVTRSKIQWSKVLQMRLVQ
eukprot:CAMPEP_0170749184 /NCGR_PEP_ID=MMETSP0437-20130122/10262_1 /TAXON_ID=0 /ORGANISM="Sexangularia sp." /LENGTH=275 /DNA_ID=CAMNT_0011088095 /DNA_START=71 /DNA_END=895 /DNA_ORIENTATION=+